MTTEAEFIDHYEALQLSQNADAEMVERVYRLLAKRYHPDNGASGDEARFRAVHLAYEVLSDPERRAAFDVRYDERQSTRWKIFDRIDTHGSHGQDRRVFRAILSLLYAARRRNPQSGGLGTIRLEEILGVPREHLEFPIWYLRKKGLIEPLQSGELAITIDGIDDLMEGVDEPSSNGRLLADTSGESSSPSSEAD